MAIEHSLVVLSWFENHTKEEMPPEHIWEDAEGLEEWWERVRDKRGLPSQKSTSSNTDEQPDEDLDNELARALKE